MDNLNEGRVILELEVNKGFSDESDLENLSDDLEFERMCKKLGMIMKYKRLFVKFFVFKEYILNDDKCIDFVKDINLVIVFVKCSLFVFVMLWKIFDLFGILGKRL